MDKKSLVFLAVVMFIGDGLWYRFSWFEIGVLYLLFHIAWNTTRK